MPSTLLPFIGACLLIAASPGPSTVLIIRHSLAGRRAGMMTVLGNETGVFVWGVVAAFGLTALLVASQVAYGVMRVVGAVVLIVFGIQALRSARRPAAESAAAAGGGGLEPPPAGVSGARAYRAGLLMNLANPKVAVFALSFLPHFVPEGSAPLPTMVGLAALWAVLEVGYYAVYVWFVVRMKRLLGRASVRRRLDFVSGVVLLGLGVRLALEG